MSAVVFEVEHAGCESCAALVRRALEHLVDVAEIAIDEEADSTTVTLARATTSSEDQINHALEEVSHGSGHAYRVRPGSWQIGG